MLGVILKQEIAQGVDIPQGTEVEVLGVTFSNLYPVSVYQPIKYKGKKLYVRRENLKFKAE